jgi:hypothetical protein
MFNLFGIMVLFIIMIIIALFPYLMYEDDKDMKIHNAIQRGVNENSVLSEINKLMRYYDNIGYGRSEVVDMIMETLVTYDINKINLWESQLQKLNLLR